MNHFFEFIDLVHDCGDILYKNVDSETGLEKVYGNCLSPQNCQFDVTCDQDTIGGGWLVWNNLYFTLLPKFHLFLIIQRQANKTLDFSCTWEEYKNGFGDQTQGDFWIGMI